MDTTGIFDSNLRLLPQQFRNAAVAGVTKATPLQLFVLSNPPPQTRIDLTVAAVTQFLSLATEEGVASDVSPEYFVVGTMGSNSVKAFQDMLYSIPRYVIHRAREQRIFPQAILDMEEDFEKNWLKIGHRIASTVEKKHGTRQVIFFPEELLLHVVGMFTAAGLHDMCFWPVQTPGTFLDPLPELQRHLSSIIKEGENNSPNWKARNEWNEKIVHGLLEQPQFQFMIDRFIEQGWPLS